MHSMHTWRMLVRVTMPRASNPYVVCDPLGGVGFFRSFATFVPTSLVQHLEIQQATNNLSLFLTAEQELCCLTDILT